MITEWQHDDFTISTDAARLFTRDARGLYEKYGFTDVAGPSLFMERKQKKS